MVGIMGALLLACFVAGTPARWSYESSTDCGSAFMPNFVSTHARSGCESTLAGARAVVLGCGLAAMFGAIAGVKRSGSVGRLHTRAWHACLVIGVGAAFFVAWTMLAWLAANALAYEPS